MNTRQDDPTNIVHIDRKIPLWGILGVLAMIAGQAVLMYITQREQGIALQQMVVQGSGLTNEVKGLRQDMTERSLKDVERDLRTNDLERRVRVLEEKSAR